jgi:hypothetical protein
MNQFGHCHSTSSGFASHLGQLLRYLVFVSVLIGATSQVLAQVAPFTVTLSSPANSTQVANSVTFSGTVRGSTGTNLSFRLLLGTTSINSGGTSLSSSCVNSSCTSSFSSFFQWPYGVVSNGNQVVSLVTMDSTGRTVTVSRTLNVIQPTPQIISFGVAPNLIVGGTDTVSATGGASGNAVTFTSKTPTICNIVGSTITALATGNCIVAANQTGNASYDAASQVTQTISVIAAAQSVSFGLAPTLSVGGKSTVTAVGGGSGLAVTFSSTTPTICTVVGSSVTALATGSCIVVANQAGNANYTSAVQATQTIDVSAGSQTISFGSAPLLSVGATGLVTATGGASDNAVTFGTTTPNVCTLNGNTVSGLIAGNCIVTANQSGNTNYNSSTEATQTIVVGTGVQNISYGPAPSLVIGGIGTVSATGGASGNAVTFTSTTSMICTVTGSTVTVSTAGDCVIAANQTGNANYNAAAQATQTIVVSAGTQSVGFGSTPTLAVGGTGTVTASGGASGNAVTFSSTTALVCSVTGSTVTALTAGSCVVAANQAGNANYSAAPQATQTITIAAATQTLSLEQGWNLVGNSTDTPINVTTTFADSSQFVTVWKWVGNQSVWSFYAPGLEAQSSTALADYAASKGYQVLNSVAGGEGFWVNVKQPASVSVTQGQSITVASVGSTLLKGWNLVSVGESATPKQFCDVQSTGVTTLWAWDAAGSAWYFYAPALDTSGGLTSYVNGKGYLDFTANSQMLGAGVGFWVNKP